MNTAQVIPFRKPQDDVQEASKSMYSDRFTKGYVMSSLLYRKEVRPFLTDAARNVYAELEDSINGHNKESDFVSYSQLQGGSIPGSRKLSRGTVADGVEELIQKGVISVTATGPRGVKKYKINEISLIQQSDNRTSANSELVRVVYRTSSGSEPVTSSGSELTIDNIDIIDKDDDKAREEKFTAQENRPLNFVEYHPLDRTTISFPELCKKYPAQLDFQDQAKASFPNHSPDRIFENLKKMAQWSLDKSNHTPQKWMTIWLDTFMKNMPTDAEQATQQARQTKKSNSSPKPQKKYHRYGQAQQQPEIRDVGGNHE